MIYVMDAGAIIALFKNEPGGANVAAIMDEPKNSCYIHSINLCEIYYGIRRDKGEQYAQTKLSQLRDVGLIECNDMDAEFWQQAGQIKADYRRVSLADCFCIVTANRLGAELLTCDRHELEAIAKAGLCRIRFLR